MPATDLAPILASLLPRVEDPWPDTIGLEFPFALAGVVGVLAGFVRAEASNADRDRAIRQGGLHGFRAGALFYALSLFNQVLSGV